MKRKSDGATAEGTKLSCSHMPKWTYWTVVRGWSEPRERWKIVEVPPPPPPLWHGWWLPFYHHMSETKELCGWRWYETCVYSSFYFSKALSREAVLLLTRETMFKEEEERSVPNLCSLCRAMESARVSVGGNRIGQLSPRTTLSFK